MHAEDLLVDDGCDGQTVETVSECLPQLNVVTPLALVIETVDAVNGSTLVVATEQEKVLWVLDFVSQQQTHGLKRLFATVHVVAQEKVVSIGRETTIFEQSQQVIVLAMDIA